MCGITRLRKDLTLYGYSRDKTGESNQEDKVD